MEHYKKINTKSNFQTSFKFTNLWIYKFTNWSKKVESYKLKKYKNSKVYTRMEKTVEKFGDNEIEKQNFW